MGDIESMKWILKEQLPIHLFSINGTVCIFILYMPKNKNLFEFTFFGATFSRLISQMIIMKAY